MTTAPVGGSSRQVLQLGQAVLAGTEQERVAGEGGVERVRRTGVGADGLDADADDGRLLGQPAGALDAHAGRVRARLVGVEELVLAWLRASHPVRRSSQPPSGSGAVLGLPGPRCARPRAGSQDRPRPGRRRRGRRPARPAGEGATCDTSVSFRPVTQWIGASRWVPVCSPVRDVVPVPAGPRSSYRLISRSSNGSVWPNGFGQDQDRRLRRKRSGEVDDSRSGRSRRRSSRSSEQGHSRLLVVSSGRCRGAACRRFADQLAAAAWGRRCARSAACAGRPRTAPASRRRLPV